MTVFFIPNGEADDSVELMFCYGFSLAVSVKH